MSCKDVTACLGEWSSGIAHASTTITSHVEAFRFLNRLEQDPHLVVVTHKAPHEVQRQCLLHVPFKVMKVVLSHVRKVKACVPNFSQTTNNSARPRLTSFKMQTSSSTLANLAQGQQSQQDHVIILKHADSWGLAKTLSRTDPQFQVTPSHCDITLKLQVKHVPTTTSSTLRCTISVKR